MKCLSVSKLWVNLVLRVQRRRIEKTPNITLDEFQELLPLVCSRETSFDPAGWSPENPLWAHGIVVSLLAQDIFGGELLRAEIRGVKGFENINSLYWNRLADGTEIDFTKSQFGNNFPPLQKTEIREREQVLEIPGVERNYNLLVTHFNDLLKLQGRMQKKVA